MQIEPIENLEMVLSSTDVLIVATNAPKPTVTNEIVGKIANGLDVIVGIESDDNQTDIDWIVQKLIGLRIFNDLEGKMNLSIGDVSGELLVVSQFTLHASTKNCLMVR